jgi:molybdopterin synthase sulfur carrier subunit
MSIQVKFFASLRERFDQNDTSIAARPSQTVQDVWQAVLGEQAMPANILMAVNMEYVDAGQAVKDGDEVAFFPPVTGG